MHPKTNTVDVYAPGYYRGFKCTADKCRHSCCIDWEIRIDRETLEKYKGIENIYRTVDECGEDAHFVLTEEGRCPHLSDCGLCNIIVDCGEDHLSEICRNHPRFFNRVAEDRCEAGLGIVCEEACRLVLEADEPFSLSLIASDKVNDGGGAESFDCFDKLGARDEIMSVIEASRSYSEAALKLKAGFRLPEIHTEDEWFDRFLELEILDTVWAEMLKSAKITGLGTEDSARPQKSSGAELDIYCKRLLKYFVYRHVSMAGSRDNFRARLGFSILSVEMIRSIFESGDVHTFDTLAEISRLYSSEIEYSEDNTAELIFEFEIEL